MDYQSFPYAGTAAQALCQLDETYRDWSTWSTGVRGLSGADLAAPCGPAEGSWDDAPMAELVLHINREAIHHGAEIAVLRDLYRDQPS
jgi:hypothetical protein